MFMYTYVWHMTEILRKLGFHFWLNRKASQSVNEVISFPELLSSICMSLQKIIYLDIIDD